MDSRLERVRAFIVKHAALLAIVLIALALRFGFLARNWNNLEFDASFLVHAEVARNILNNQWYQIDKPYLDYYIATCRAEKRLIDPEDFPPPDANHTVEPLYADEGGYGVLLSLLWKMFGSNRWWHIRVLQVILDALMCFLIFSIGKTAFDRHAGLIASFFYACFIPEIEMAVRPHRDVWVTFLFITSVFMLVRISSDQRVWKSFALLGLFAGLVALMRSTALLFVFFMVPILFLTVPRKTAARCAIVLCITFATAMSPIIIHNYDTFGQFMPTRGTVWHSFWGGVGQMPNKFGLVEDDGKIFQFAKTLDSTVVFTTPHYEETLKKAAISFVRQNPLWYLSSVLRRAFAITFPKLGRALFFQPVSGNITGFLNNIVNMDFLILVDTLIVLLACLGIWLWRLRWRMVTLILLPYFYTLITLSPLVFQGRNLYNFYPVVLLLAAASLSRLWNLFRQSSPSAS